MAANGGYFRLAVDRAFSVAGSGIVVTGTAFSGQVAVGDELLLGNAGRPVRVRGLHAQNRPAQQAWAGQRVALNIAGERLALEQIQRGDWLLQAALHAPTTRVDIDFRLLPDELRDFTHWTPVHLHLGTQDVTGRLALLEGEQLEPGHRAFAQLVLNAPIQALHGDRLVLRDQSAQRTLGGGRVLDGVAPARNRRSPERLEQLRALQGRKAWRRRCRPCSARPRTASTRNAWCNPSTARARAGGCPPHWPRSTRGLALGCSPPSAGPRCSSNCSMPCNAFTPKPPDELGPDRDRLRRYALPQLERPVFISLLDSLPWPAARLHSSGPWLHLPDHRVHLGESGGAAARTPLAAARSRPLRPALGPRPGPGAGGGGGRRAPVAAQARPPGPAAAGGAGPVLPRAATLRELAEPSPCSCATPPASSAPPTFRDRLGIGRKRSIQLLEHFDRIGLTRRFGNERRIREDSALAQGSA